MYTNRQIWNVSYPIFLSLLAQNVINVTDTAFLGRVGEIELGASAMGGLYYICAFTIAFGFSTGSQIIMLAVMGSGSYKEVGPVSDTGCLFPCLCWLPSCLLCHVCLPGILCGVLISSDTNFFSECHGRILGLACVRVLFLFCECDVPCFVYRYYPDEGADTECCCDGVDECAAGLPADIR